VLRRAAYVLIATGAAVGIAYLATALAPHQDGSGAAAFWTGVIVFVLSGYTTLALAVTSAPAGASARALASGAGFGVTGGLAGFALVPFTQSYDVGSPWVGAAYVVACATVAVGTPAASAFVAARRSGDLGQGVAAGTIAGGVAALVLYIVGLAALRSWPGLLDTSVFDKGVSWLPSDPNADAEGYLLALVLLPLVSLPIAGLGAGLATARPKSRSLTAGGLALATLLCIPLQHTLFDGSDSTSFGAVGTTNVSFSADGLALLTTNADQVSVLWNLSAAGRPVRTATFPGMAAFAPDGRTVATRGRLWRITGAAQPTRGARFGDQGDPEAFSPDGRLLAVDGANGGSTGTVWDVSNYAHPKRVGRFTGQWAAFSPDGRTFATSAPCWWDSPPTVRSCGTTLWSVSPGSRPSRLATIGGGDAIFSPDGRTLATRAIDSTVVLWRLGDLRHPLHIATLTTGRDDDPPSTLVFSPDGRWLATGGEEGAVRLWNAARPGRPVTLPPAHPYPNSGQIGASSTLTKVAFSRDGRTLVTVMGNDLATRWNVADPRHPIRTAVLTRRTRGAGMLAFSRDATTIAGAATDGSNHVSLWHIR
jgi:WD40 repeat protein